MKVNNLQIPNALQACLKSGKWDARGKGSSGRWTNNKHIELFRSVFPFVDHPFPSLYGFDMMCRESDFTGETLESLSGFLGRKSAHYGPGDLDIQKAILIGETEPDGFIALDYRTPQPSVIYFCNPNDLDWHWLLATDSIEELLERLELV